MKKSIKTIIVILIIAIIIIGIYFIFGYVKKQNRLKEVNEYKKDFYYGILCEYSCPLVLQEYNNKTQLLPTLDCVKGCTNPFRNKYYGTNFTKEELEKDDLLKDIETAVKNCKTTSLNTSSMTLDNKKYFDCASTNVKNIQIKYLYLIE